jgi:hypothetical protein
MVLEKLNTVFSRNGLGSVICMPKDDAATVAAEVVLPKEPAFLPLTRSNL